MYECLICNKPVPEYEPKFCCNGSDCGCMGQPTEPCVCSDICAKALFGGIGKPYIQRRIDAGIELFKNQQGSGGVDRHPAIGTVPWGISESVSC